MQVYENHGVSRDHIGLIRCTEVGEYLTWTYMHKEKDSAKGDSEVFVLYDMDNAEFFFDSQDFTGVKNWISSY